MSSNNFDKKAVLKEVFTRGARGYGDIAYFQELGQQLVDIADISVGDKVLDVACGRGAVLFPAVQKVGPQGEVIGIDLADGMVQETTAEIQRRRITNAHVRLMDAEHLQFPDNYFDFALCGFALQFFPHLDRALSEFRRVLKPAGRLAASAWGEFEDPRWDWFEDLIDKYQARASLGTNSVDRPEKVKPWLTQAGFVDVRTITRKVDTKYADEADYWNMRWSISGRAGLEKLSSSDVEKLKTEVFEKMQVQREHDGFHDLFEVHFTIAVRA